MVEFSLTFSSGTDFPHPEIFLTAALAFAGNKQGTAGMFMQTVVPVVDGFQLPAAKVN